MVILFVLYFKVYLWTEKLCSTVFPICTYDGRYCKFLKGIDIFLIGNISFLSFHYSNIDNE